LLWPVAIDGNATLQAALLAEVWGSRSALTVPGGTVPSALLAALTDVRTAAALAGAEACAGVSCLSSVSGNSSSACAMCHCSGTFLARLLALAASRRCSIRWRVSGGKVTGDKLLTVSAEACTELGATLVAAALFARVRRPAVSFSRLKAPPAVLARFLALASSRRASI
jgi:hypothetical protein